MKHNEIFNLLKIPEEIANKAYVHELQEKIAVLEKRNHALTNKTLKLQNCIQLQGVALRRRNTQIKALKDELFIQSMFVDEKYKV